MLKLDLNESLWRRSAGYSYARAEDYARVRKKLAAYARVKPAELLITNGSYHALDLIFSFIFKHQGKILLPVPTFPFYDKHEATGKLRFDKIPHRDDFSADDILRRLTGQKFAGLYLSNPNNPLGYCFTVSDLKKIVARAAVKRALVVIDEAYFEFCNITVKNLINKYPNLIIVRSLSKSFGLAGARAGYVVANSRRIAELETLKGPPYIVSHLSLRAIERALGEKEKMEKLAAETNAVKKDLENFCRHNQLVHFPGRTNFLTVKVPNSRRLINYLAQKNILIKDLSDYPDGGELLQNCVRITIPPAPQLTPVKRVLAEALGLT